VRLFPPRRVEVACERIGLLGLRTRMVIKGQTFGVPLVSGVNRGGNWAGAQQVGKLV
jgi:hypothetical protein